jgi:hypothetical protein
MTISIIYLVTFHPNIFRLRVIFSKILFLENTNILLETKILFLENKSSFLEKTIFKIKKRNYCGHKSAFG